MTPAQNGLSLGTYQASVKLIDANGTTQLSAGPQAVTFVNANLSGVNVYPNLRHARTKACRQERDVSMA